jgi:hypothetical protein
VLRTGCQDRKDELLGALVRATHADPGAFGVVAACLLPGLRRRVARYARSLDRQEALAVMVDALYEAVAGYDAADDSRFVASGLLALPTRRLRRAATDQRSWSLHAATTSIRLAQHPVWSCRRPPCWRPRSTPVWSPTDARLILDTRISGRSLREAAQGLGLRYETAKKRRQRAEARWATWWTSSGAPPVSLRCSAGRPRCQEVA